MTVSKSFYCHRRSCNWTFLVWMICQNVLKSMRFQKKTKGWEIKFGKLKDQSMNSWSFSILFLYKKILDSNRTEGRRIDRSVKLTWSATALTTLSILNRALHFHSDHYIPYLPSAGKLHNSWKYAFLQTFSLPLRITFPSDSDFSMYFKYASRTSTAEEEKD